MRDSLKIESNLQVLWSSCIPQAWSTTNHFNSSSITYDLMH